MAENVTCLPSLPAMVADWTAATAPDSGRSAMRDSRSSGSCWSLPDRVSTAAGNRAAIRLCTEVVIDCRPTSTTDSSRLASTSVAAIVLARCGARSADRTAIRPGTRSSGGRMLPSSQAIPGSSTGPAASTAPKASAAAVTTRIRARCWSDLGGGQPARGDRGRGQRGGRADPLDPVPDLAGGDLGRGDRGRSLPAHPRRRADRGQQRDHHGAGQAGRHQRPGQARVGQVLAEAVADRQPDQLHQAQRQRQPEHAGEQPGHRRVDQQRAQHLTAGGAHPAQQQHAALLALGDDAEHAERGDGGGHRRGHAEHARARRRCRPARRRRPWPARRTAPRRRRAPARPCRARWPGRRCRSAGGRPRRRAARRAGSGRRR